MLLKRSHRLAVRTPDSHSGNTGSIPVGSAKFEHIPSEPANLVTQTSCSLLITQLTGFLFTRFPVGSAKFNHKHSRQRWIFIVLFVLTQNNMFYTKNI